MLCLRYTHVRFIVVAAIIIIIITIIRSSFVIIIVGVVIVVVYLMTDQCYNLVLVVQVFKDEKIVMF